MTGNRTDIGNDQVFHVLVVHVDGLVLTDRDWETVVDSLHHRMTASKDFSFRINSGNEYNWV